MLFRSGSFSVIRRELRGVQIGSTRVVVSGISATSIADTSVAAVIPCSPGIVACTGVVTGIVISIVRGRSVIVVASSIIAAIVVIIVWRIVATSVIVAIVIAGATLIGIIQFGFFLSLVFIFFGFGNRQYRDIAQLCWLQDKALGWGVVVQGAAEIIVSANTKFQRAEIGRAHV